MKAQQKDIEEGQIVVQKEENKNIEQIKEQPTQKNEILVIKNNAKEEKIKPTDLIVSKKEEKISHVDQKNKVAHQARQQVNPNNNHPNKVQKDMKKKEEQEKLDLLNREHQRIERERAEEQKKIDQKREQEQLLLLKQQQEKLQEAQNQPQNQQATKIENNQQIKQQEADAALLIKNNIEIELQLKLKQQEEQKKQAEEERTKQQQLQELKYKELEKQQELDAQKQIEEEARRIEIQKQQQQKRLEEEEELRRIVLNLQKQEKAKFELILLEQQLLQQKRVEIEQEILYKTMQLDEKTIDAQRQEQPLLISQDCSTKFIEASKNEPQIQQIPSQDYNKEAFQLQQNGIQEKKVKKMKKIDIKKYIQSVETKKIIKQKKLIQNTLKTIEAYVNQIEPEQENYSRRFRKICEFYDSLL